MDKSGINEELGQHIDDMGVVVANLLELIVIPAGNQTRHRLAMVGNGWHGQTIINTYILGPGHQEVVPDDEEQAFRLLGAAADTILRGEPFSLVLHTADFDNVHHIDSEGDEVPWITVRAWFVHEGGTVQPLGGGEAMTMVCLDKSGELTGPPPGHLFEDAWEVDLLAGVGE